MLEHEAIHDGSDVHTKLLTLTTSCPMYNLFQGALTREALKVLRRRAGGKLESREQERGEQAEERRR